jgi:hypothetical protein
MKGNLGKRAVSLALVMAAILALVAPAAAWSDEISPGPETVLPDYVGAPAKPHPTANSRVPQNPFLWPNPFNMVHMDPWNSDIVDIAGPLGRDPITFSSTLAAGRRGQDPLSDMFECTGMTFTSHGRIIASCFGVDEASAVLLDPDTLEVYDTELLPATRPEDVGNDRGQSTLTNGLSASYILVDKDGRFFVTIKEGDANKITSFVEGGTEAGPTLERDHEHEYDLSPWVPANNRVSGLNMDWQGRIWFYLSGSVATDTTAAIGGAVYVLDPTRYPDADAVKSYQFGADEQVRNSLALTKEGAAYVVTAKKMYRLDLDASGTPHPVWGATYENCGHQKPGQYNAGSGTTPTILGNGKYVAITDNAVPNMHVVVYRTAKQVDPEKQVVCEVPVFEYAEGGALDNSLLGYGNSLVVENNYGYVADFEDFTPTPSEPGFERIDIDPNGKGCTKVWVNKEVVSTTSGKLSTRTGLIYLYERKYDDQNTVWVYYWTALDFRTGEVVWQKMAGTGYEQYDSSWPALVVGPNKTLYVGVFGGLISIRDGR